MSFVSYPPCSTLHSLHLSHKATRSPIFGLCDEDKSPCQTFGRGLLCGRRLGDSGRPLGGRQKSGISLRIFVTVDRYAIALLAPSGVCIVTRWGPFLVRGGGRPDAFLFTPLWYRSVKLFFYTPRPSFTAKSFDQIGTRVV